MEGKRLISFFLTFCFSVFLGHNLVPHHHHAMEVNVALTGDCSATHEVNHQPESHPLHCHAFNGIEFLKYSTFEIYHSIGVIDLLLTSSSRIPTEHPASFEVRISNVLTLPHKTFEYLGSFSLRAPPLSA